MANSPSFIGFSTLDRKKPPYKLTDFDLVKRDLSNSMFNIWVNQIEPVSYTHLTMTPILLV